MARLHIVWEVRMPEPDHSYSQSGDMGELPCRTTSSGALQDIDKTGFTLLPARRTASMEDTDRQAEGAVSLRLGLHSPGDDSQPNQRSRRPDMGSTETVDPGCCRTASGLSPLSIMLTGAPGGTVCGGSASPARVEKGLCPFSGNELVDCAPWTGSAQGSEGKRPDSKLALPACGGPCSGCSESCTTTSDSHSESGRESEAVGGATGGVPSLQEKRSPLTCFPKLPSLSTGTHFHGGEKGDGDKSLPEVKCCEPLVTVDSSAFQSPPSEGFVLPRSQGLGGPDAIYSRTLDVACSLIAEARELLRSIMSVQRGIVKAQNHLMSLLNSTVVGSDSSGCPFLQVPMPSTGLPKQTGCHTVEHFDEQDKTDMKVLLSDSGSEPLPTAVSRGQLLISETSTSRIPFHGSSSTVQRGAADTSGERTELDGGSEMLPVLSHSLGSHNKELSTSLFEESRTGQGLAPSISIARGVTDSRDGAPPQTFTDDFRDSRTPAAKEGPGANSFGAAVPSTELPPGVRDNIQNTFTRCQIQRGARRHTMACSSPTQSVEGVKLTGSPAQVACAKSAPGRPLQDEHFPDTSGGRTKRKLLNTEEAALRSDTGERHPDLQELAGHSVESPNNVTPLQQGLARSTGPKKLRPAWPREDAPMPGVRFAKDRNSWVAFWCENGKQNYKSFSNKKFGCERARLMAISARHAFDQRTARQQLRQYEQRLNERQQKHNGKQGQNLSGAPSLCLEKAFLGNTTAIAQAAADIPEAVLSGALVAAALSNSTQGAGSAKRDVSAKNSPSEQPCSSSLGSSAPHNKAPVEILERAALGLSLMELQKLAESLSIPQLYNAPINSLAASPPARSSPEPTGGAMAALSRVLRAGTNDCPATAANGEALKENRKQSVLHACLADGYGETLRGSGSSRDATGGIHGPAQISCDWDSRAAAEDHSVGNSTSCVSGNE
ncbi:ap2 domain transcription factor ap2ix-1 [Cystoisospora suis]|uniref:Ap2 domain transcription factor ap2ix-1 n=1 Tax=Cystoisospora suis TaxID=483139 RepID=A0A2C6LIC9_9APIC|nr:ap2 domain transcription factor ap2ix-1 [Cystoisospora suis]